MFENLGNLIRKVGATLGMNKSLIDVVDDDRVNMPASEYKRIAKDFRLYRNDYDDIFEHVGKSKHRRRQHTINMTKTVARRMASIVFNEKAKVSFKNNEVNNFIEDVLADNDFYNQFETNLEKGIVAGGFAMRPYVDDKKIKIAWIRADQFYPLRSNTNDIPECAVVSKTQRIENHTVIYYSLLEFHQWDDNGNYIITNELYRSDNKAVIGYQVPLNRLYDDLQDQTNLGNLQAPLFAYFHTPGANNISLESPLGVGIVDNARGELTDINLINDAIHREVRYGKKRIVVPESMLKIDEVHKPYFDPEDPTYVGFNGDDDMQIKDITTNMRIDQLKSAMDFALRKLEVQVGLSAGTFSYDDSGLKTATEVVSDNSMTYQTRSSYLTMVEKSIKQLCTAILELADINGLFSYDSTQDPGFDIYFDDGLFVDKDKQLDEDMKAAVAKLIPIKQFLIRNYGLNDKDADQWIEQIQEEQPTMTTNSFEDDNSPDDYQGADD